MKNISSLTTKLAKLGFEHETGPRGEKGYTKTISHENNSEVLWITVDPDTNIIYLYNEYDVGGMLWDDEIDTEDLNEIFKSDKSFSDWIKTHIDTDEELRPMS